MTMTDVTCFDRSPIADQLRERTTMKSLRWSNNAYIDDGNAGTVRSPRNRVGSWIINDKPPHRVD